MESAKDKVAETSAALEEAIIKTCVDEASKAADAWAASHDEDSDILQVPEAPQVCSSFSASRHYPSSFVHQCPPAIALTRRVSSILCLVIPLHTHTHPHDRSPPSPCDLSVSSQCLFPPTWNSPPDL